VVIWQRNKPGAGGAQPGAIALPFLWSRIDSVNAGSSPSMTPEPRSASSEGLRRSPALLALTLLAICGRAEGREQVATQEQIASQEPVAAVWKKHEIVFTYQSFIAIYSCDALEDRVASILYAVGARPDMEIKVTGCSRSAVPLIVPTIDRARRTLEPGSRTDYLPRTDVQQVSTVHVLLSMPVEMTPDVVEDLKADKSRRELISRVTGNPVPRFDDPIPFAAERRIVTISNKTVGIEPVECELLDQLVTSSFSNLGIEVVRRGYSCDRRRVSRIYPTLDAEALVPVQFESRGKQQTPAENGDDTEPSAPATSDEEPASSGDEPAENAADRPPE